MLFTSYGFIGFLAVLFVLYYLIPKRFQWILLLLGSYVFYTLASPKYMLYILATTVTTFYAAKYIGRLTVEQKKYIKINKETLTSEEKKAYKAKIKTVQKKWLIGTMLLNFGILAIAKYTNFAIANLNYMFEATGQSFQLSFWNIALPMGISFYTFQSMGYLIDVYRGKYEAQNHLPKFALFVSFFPQLIQGPISRYDDMSKTLYQEHSYDQNTVKRGFQRILWGYFKKVVIADRLLVAVTTIVQAPEVYDGVFVFIGMLLYAYQLYADFTGGIDITIGIAQVFGVQLKENFQQPYFSKNIAEYWRRWHITMGTWFKDYLFYPISVSKPMLKLSKFSRQKFGDAIGKRIPVYLATLIVWFTTGLWHGSSWNFIVWGLMNGIVIILSLEMKPFYEWFHGKFNVQHLWYFKLFQIIRTILLMSSIRMFDTYRNVPLTFKMFGTMFTRFDISDLWNRDLMGFGLSLGDYVILFVCLIVLVLVSTIQTRGSVRDWLSQKSPVFQYGVHYALILALLVFGAYGINYDSSQFIYNQF